MLGSTITESFRKLALSTAVLEEKTWSVFLGEENMSPL